MEYANYETMGKQYTIPAAFTALNGSAQTFTLTAGVALVADADASDEEKATAQANLLRVLEVLRSNGAQPIITKVEGTDVTFTLEQSWVYGLRAPAQPQVSERKLEEEAIADIEAIFGEIKAVDGETKLFASVTVDSTIGALEEDKAASESSNS